MKLVYDLAVASITGLIIFLIAWYSLSQNLLIGPIILLMGTIPIIAGIFRGINTERMIPDMIFGATIQDF